MTSEPDAAADADMITPDGPSAPGSALEAKAGMPGAPLTPRRFLGALALTSVLYLLFLMTLATLGGGSLSLVAALLFAVWAGRRLTGIRGWRPWLVLAGLSFVLVVVLSVIIITWLAAAGGPTAGS